METDTRHRLRLSNETGRDVSEALSAEQRVGAPAEAGGALASPLLSVILK